MSFYHNLVTQKSLQLLQELRSQYEFILIGGWAVFLYTHALKSKDIDLVLEYDELKKLSEDFVITKNQRLKKYEAKIEEIDIDIYVPFFSNPGLPAQDLKKYTVEREGFRVLTPETLLILKQKAYMDRRDSPKGEKDKIDIFSLLKDIKINWPVYKKIIKQYDMLYLKNEFINLLNITFEIKEIGLNRHKFSQLKKKILEDL